MTLPRRSPKKFNNSVMSSARLRKLMTRQTSPVVIASTLVGIVILYNVWTFTSDFSPGTTVWSEEAFTINMATNVSFERAKRESFGFFQDIPDYEWKLLESITRSRENHAREDQPLGLEPQTFYQENWEPDFSCRFERRVAIPKMGDGGKWICDPHRIALQSHVRKKGCLVYSVGSQGNFMFEKGVHELLGGICEIHVFDMGDYTSAVPEELKSVVHFHALGLKPSDLSRIEVVPFYDVQSRYENLDYADEEGKKFFSLPDIVKKVGHRGRTIDIFKIDCEGCEWDTVDDWLDPQFDLRQILVEVHAFPKNKANNFFELMQKRGYVTFHKEPNIQYGGGECVEYGFLKLSNDFIRGNSTSAN